MINRIYRSLILLNLALIAVTAFSYCTKEDESLYPKKTPQNILDDRTVLPSYCEFSFKATDPLDVCGAQTNINSCTSPFGGPLYGLEYGTKGNYTLASTSMICFTNNNSTAVDLTIILGGSTTVNIAPGVRICVVIKNCTIVAIF